MTQPPYPFQGDRLRPSRGRRQAPGSDVWHDHVAPMVRAHNASLLWPGAPLQTGLFASLTKHFEAKETFPCPGVLSVPRSSNSAGVLAGSLLRIKPHRLFISAVSPSVVAWVPSQVVFAAMG